MEKNKTIAQNPSQSGSRAGVADKKNNGVLGIEDIRRVAEYAKTYGVTFEEMLNNAVTFALNVYDAYYRNMDIVISDSVEGAR